MGTPWPQSKRAGRLRPFVDGYLVPVDVHVDTPAEVEEGRAVRYSFLDTVILLRGAPSTNGPMVGRDSDRRRRHLTPRTDRPCLT